MTIHRSLWWPQETWGAVTPDNDQVEVPAIMRALDDQVVDAIWEIIRPLVPPRPDRHPLGCHRARASEGDCFEVILARLVTGCSWEDA